MRNLTALVCAPAVLSIALIAQPAETIQHARQQAATEQAFFAHQAAGPARLTKGAPFSAETLTEFRQTLADGNLIERKHRGAMYRDGEGRVRTEQALGVGAIAPAGGAQEVAIIRDPVAGVQWVLNPDTKTAMKTVIPAHAGAPAGERREPLRMRHPAPGMGVEAPKEEKLGTANINGVQAEGTRITVSISAGQMGNVRPIEMVTERWFAPQLQIVVKSRHTDPRTGEQLFEMTNIRQGEPPASLFQPPADYTVIEGPQMKMRQPGPVPHEE
jgi:hypothetical protein